MPENVISLDVESGVFPDKIDLTIINDECIETRRYSDYELYKSVCAANEHWQAENAKLRELVNKWANAFDRWAAENGGYGRVFDATDWQALANDMRIDLAEACGELGVEVTDG